MTTETTLSCPSPLSADDDEFLRVREESERRISAIFGVPASLLMPAQSTRDASRDVCSLAVDADP